MLNGIKEDDSLLPLIYCLDEDDDWGDSENWVKANPSLGETIAMDYLQEQYTQAKNYGSSEEANFKTKHLNEWVSAVMCGSRMLIGWPAALIRWR